MRIAMIRQVSFSPTYFAPSPCYYVRLSKVSYVKRRRILLQNLPL